IFFMAALASSVVASMETVWPLISPSPVRILTTHRNMALCVSTQYSRRVRETQKAAQRQRISRAPGNATLRVNAFKVADEECPKIDPRGQARPAIRALLVELAAQRFHPGIELMLTQDLIQPLVKRIAGSLDYGARCDPHIALPLPPLPRSHRHAEKTLTTFLTSHVVNEKITTTTGC